MLTNHSRCFFTYILVHCCCYSVAKSCPTLRDPMDCSTPRLPCPSLSPRVCSNSCPLSWWCHPTISSSVSCFSSYLQSFPASGSFPMNQLFASGGQIIGASAYIEDWLVWSPWCPRSSQDSSSTPQFESINSWALSLLYGPTLISIHDYWKNNSFDYTNL